VFTEGALAIKVVIAVLVFILTAFAATDKLEDEICGYMDEYPTDSGYWIDCATKVDTIEFASNITGDIPNVEEKPSVKAKTAL